MMYLAGRTTFNYNFSSFLNVSNIRNKFKGNNSKFCSLQDTLYAIGSVMEPNKMRRSAFEASITSFSPRTFYIVDRTKSIIL